MSQAQYEQQGTVELYAFATTRMRFDAKYVPCPMSGCWLWTAASHKLGYGLMNALGESKAHRVSWRLHRGTIPQGMSILHKCDVRCCVNPGHLFLGTQTDNMRDMVAKGRARKIGNRGAKHPLAKLTQSAIVLMQLRRQSLGHSYARIGRDFGVAAMTAYRAINGQSWRHE